MASIWIGFDPREADSFAICRHSLERHATYPIQPRGIVLSDLQRRGWYRRPVERRGEQLYDPISEAPMSTEFAISRFFTPLLAKHGWALFMDCDILARDNIARLFDYVEFKKQYAVLCVKHKHNPSGQLVKMDGQAQVKYARKNWSSVMMFNCDHESNKLLTLDMLNVVPGRDLHRFCWLEDHEIGELSPVWNYLVGYTKKEELDDDPKLVHFTSGTPSMRGYENCEYADEYRMEMELWAS